MVKYSPPELCKNVLKSLESSGNNSRHLLPLFTSSECHFFVASIKIWTYCLLAGWPLLFAISANILTTVLGMAVPFLASMPSVLYEGRVAKTQGSNIKPMAGVWWGLDNSDSLMIYITHTGPCLAWLLSILYFLHLNSSCRMEACESLGLNQLLKLKGR